MEKKKFNNNIQISIQKKKKKKKVTKFKNKINL